MPENVPPDDVRALFIYDRESGLSTWNRKPTKEEAATAYAEAAARYHGEFANTGESCCVFRNDLPQAEGC